MFSLVARELVRSGELAAAVSPGASEGLLPRVRPRVSLETRQVRLIDTFMCVCEELAFTIREKI